MKESLPSGTATANTAMGDPLAATLPQQTALATRAVGEIATIDTGVVVLSAEQGRACEQALKGLDFAAMSSAQIVLIGANAEQGLHQTLDGFLARLDSKTAASLFKLFDKLQKGVADADLPAVLVQVQAVDKPGLVARLLGMLSGKSKDDLITAAYQTLTGLMDGKTRTLKDEMGKLERELGTECAKLLAELRVLEDLKTSYGKHRESFAVAAATAHAFLEQSRAYVAEQRALVEANPDSLRSTRLQELEAKLQMLESRSLALEGTYTRLPADQLVIQQIEQAGVSTLQETVTTANARFASIKMTLLALHGTLMVKSVQAMGERQATLDRQLNAVRGQLVKEVATAAANAPGDNRLAQAHQIEKIIADAKEVETIVAKAREDNAAKFAAARAVFQKARDDMSKLS